MSGLLEEMRRRGEKLVRDESGVALMLTLSIFLLLYIACAGVYAIGETVCQKVELQNACDSAAYSAAVVQADGLSRMAVINRALSWTYVQLTNVQLDYITYRWMKKTRDTFVEDRDDCDNFNRAISISNPFPERIKKKKHANGFKDRLQEMLGSAGGSIFFGTCALTGGPERRYTGEGRGWFCGVDGESGKIKLNGHVMPFNDLNDAVKSIEEANVEQDWKSAIIDMKKAIVAYNALLPVVNFAMQHSIQATAGVTLAANLPRLTTDYTSLIDTRFSAGDTRTGVDLETAKDMLWYVDARYPYDPYPPYEGANSDEDVPAGGYFSPLFNTEIGERLFLTMADGQVYNTLEEYFSNGEKGVNGGLDQWFIRSHTNEAHNAHSKSIDPGTEIPHSSYNTVGICRVYKNANRVEGGKVHRGHHVSTNPLSETDASCINLRANFPEQCAAVNESVALCAEYEWSSAKMATVCIPIIKPPFHIHIQVGLPKGVCPHLCCSDPVIPFLKNQGRSHSRAKYDQCFNNDTRLATMLIEVNSRPVVTGFKHRYINLGAIVRNSNGFARIYGDDKDVYEKETYVGEVAKPWILNESFYGKSGAIIVGMARKQRNPFAVLLDALLGERKADAPGIHSAFNPVKDGYLVAFSAARAAHHFNPSDAQKRVAPSLVGEWDGQDRDYETRYDAVCHDTFGIRNEDGTDIWKFDLDQSNSGLREMHVGCICGKELNIQRLARCWNLCETDWDATLLPLAYARADPERGWYDSYEHSLGQVGNITWENVDEQLNATRHKEQDENKLLTIFEEAAADRWFQFYDESNHLIAEDDDADTSVDDDTQLLKGSVDGDFLLMQSPKGMDGESFNLRENMKYRIL